MQKVRRIFSEIHHDSVYIQMLLIDRKHIKTYNINATKGGL